MVSFLKRYQIIIVSVLLVLFSINLAFTGKKDAPRGTLLKKVLVVTASPMQMVATGAYRLVAGVFDDYLFIVGANRENRELKAKLAGITAENNRLHEELSLDERLRETLAYKNDSPFKSVAAGVIAFNFDKWTRTVVLNKGALDGVKADMPVLTPEGVVGRITESTGHTSRVLLSQDLRSDIDVVLQRTRIKGVAEGNGTNGLSLKYIRQSDDVQVGDQVITSGLSGVFPKWISVGEVTKIEKGRDSFFMTIEVRPRVDIRKTEEVLVVTDVGIARD